MGDGIRLHRLWAGMRQTERSKRLEGQQKGWQEADAQQLNMKLHLRRKGHGCIAEVKMLAKLKHIRNSGIKIWTGTPKYGRERTFVIFFLVS